jgi:hypothetical protein
MQLLAQLTNDLNFEDSNLATADTSWKWAEKQVWQIPNPRI